MALIQNANKRKDATRKLKSEMKAVAFNLIKLPLGIDRETGNKGKRNQLP